MFAALSGISLIGLVLFDIYQTIVVPRYKPSTFRLAPFIVGRLLWPGYRKVAVGQTCPLKDVMLGSFASFGFVTLFLVWMALLVLGFGLIFLAQGSEVSPPINDLPTALYAAGSSILTLGSGDAVALSGTARLTAIAAAFTGILIMAVAVSFIFSLQGAVQKRETMVNTLESRLGSSTTGLGLMLRYKELDLAHKLGESFNQWELWAAEVLESHRAFPLLSYFRSAKACVSWVTILGALLDASALTIAATAGEATGEARLFFELATKTVQSLASFLNLKVEEESQITEEEYAQALTLLAAAGYKVRAQKDSFQHFAGLRMQYISHIRALSTHLVNLSPSLLGNLAAEVRLTAVKAESRGTSADIIPVNRARKQYRHLSLVR
ncbi:MAG: hypothetical protein JST01_23150 [Cyanobacteria bacterium SZAS TMP-1]|nr:hypothetical protein [Cyanobacteria bacterium SZAS TMP-1]